MYDMKPDLQRIDEVIAKGPYSADWASLSAYTVPDWYKSAKFGIFIHWGIYSVPAFDSEWYSRNMYLEGHEAFKHHREVWGDQDKFGYKDFIPLFRAERFDADAWAELFKDAGAKYVVPVAEHHDGFQMYKSAISIWNAAEMGPCRDTLGELSGALAKRGIVLGASSHRAEHWFFMGHGRDFESDIKEPMSRGDFYWPAMPEPDHHDMFSEPAPTEEYVDDWLVRTCELIDRYRPRVLYFDWWIQHMAFRPYLKKLAAYYYNRCAEWGFGGVICYKHDAFMFGTALPDVERGQFADVKPWYWQTDTSIALNSWGYTENNDFRDAPSLVRDLVDIVSKNGNLLLNIGPRPDGTITDAETNILRSIGAWLGRNGEAVYGSSVYRVYGEGPTEITEGQFTDRIKKNFTHRDFRFTTANGCLYATALAASPDGHYDITTFAERDASSKAVFDGVIDDITVLGNGEHPKWTRDGEALHIETDFRSDYPVVFRLKLK